MKAEGRSGQAGAEGNTSSSNSSGSLVVLALVGKPEMMASSKDSQEVEDSVEALVEASSSNSMDHKEKELQHSTAAV